MTQRHQELIDAMNKKAQEENDKKEKLEACQKSIEEIVSQIEQLHGQVMLTTVPDSYASA
jgi:predicted P-loop ATPase/GTPase